MIPGAVPAGFGSTSAPTGSSACLRLLAAITRPRSANLAVMSARTSAFSTSAAPKV
jgi:hypothetical protein